MANDFDWTEKASSYEWTNPPECRNCRQTQSVMLSFWPSDEDRPILLCDDCAREARRIEALADELTALPCCPERERIIDSATSIRQLVNLLRGHDLACGCCSGRTDLLKAA